MGNSLSSVSQDESETELGFKRKRGAEDITENETFTYWCGTPRKKSQSTAKYIYETLFVEGKDSDIKVEALGKEWNLHKLYVQQAGYFNSMFSGRWEKIPETKFLLEIVDNNINIEGLNSVFASFYSDTYEIPVDNMMGVVAAASFLQVDGILDRAAYSMAENISDQTAIEFCKCAEFYGHAEMRRVCEEWVSQCICTGLVEDVMAKLPLALVTRQINAPQLVVIHVELDVYAACRKYLYLQLFPEKINASKNLASEISAYFRAQPKDISFLETEKGIPYQALFAGIRLNTILNDRRNIDSITNDNIIPKARIENVMALCWKSVLTSGLDPEEYEFEKYAFRWGRIIDHNRTLTWRWMGFSYGFDLLVTYHKATKELSIKRNTSHQRPTSYHNANTMVCMHPRRSIIAKLMVSNKEEFGRQSYRQMTDVLHLSFSTNEEHRVMKLDENIKFPICVSLNVLFESVES